LTGGLFAAAVFRFAMEPAWLVLAGLAGLLLPFFRGLAASLVTGAGLTAVSAGLDIGLTHSVPLTFMTLASGTLALCLIFLVVWLLRKTIPVAGG